MVCNLRPRGRCSLSALTYHQTIIEVHVHPRVGSWCVLCESAGGHSISNWIWQASRLWIHKQTWPHKMKQLTAASTMKENFVPYNCQYYRAVWTFLCRDMYMSLGCVRYVMNSRGRSFVEWKKTRIKGDSKATLVIRLLRRKPSTCILQDYACLHLKVR